MLTETSSLHFGEFTLDRRLRELRRGHAVLPVAGKAFDLLSYMVANPGRPLTKSELMDAVWPETAVEESNLSQNVFLLRKVLGSGNDGPIKTLPGRGYQFAADVSEIEPVALPNNGGFPSSAISSVTMEATQTRVTVQQEVREDISLFPPWARLMVVVLVLALLGIGGWWWRQRWLDRSGGSPLKVVLAPMDGTTGDAVLDNSLTQAMRMDLAQSPYVSVVPGSTVRATLALMMRKPEDAMTAAVAREVCERTNSQGVLSGDIARIGQRFLITEEASNCVDGSVIAAAKYEVKDAEELPRGVDKLAGAMRQKLGESRRSIARFDTPLLAMGTASLDALKVYTRASILTSQGKWADAITLEKQALALDPDFPAARLDLAACYISTGDFVNGREAVSKAYEVRDKGSEPIRLSINALHEAYITQDLYAAERNYRSWTELYPRSVQAWNGLSVVQRDLGRHADSAASGLKALALAPNNQGTYVNAALEQMRSGDIKGARATLDSALAHELDGDRIRENYVQIAILQHDAALLKAQLAWIDAHPEATYSRLEQVGVALGEGRFADAHRLFAQVIAVVRQQGLGGFADAMVKNVGINLAQAGDRDFGLGLFRSVPIDPESGDDLEGLVEVGDLKTAAADLQAVRAKYPQATVWQHYFGPRVEGGIALADHKPQQAIDIMESTRPLDDRDFDMRKFRGDAYLAAGQPVLAEKEYRQIVTHREIDPELGDFPLAWLGLGRSLVAQGRRSEAIDAYRQFFSLWAHADPNAMYLMQAKQEFAKLAAALP